MELKTFFIIIFFCSFGFIRTFENNNEHHLRDSSGDDSQNDRLCQQKCKEYANHVTTLLNDSSWPHSVSSQTCSYSQGLIVGGVDAKPGEFPHMAAIGFVKPENKFQVACGGSLISENFVLTAAQCNNKKLKIVRLGCVNIETGDGLCRPQEFDIERFISHENYSLSTKNNDIAVVKLSKNVKFEIHIRPACLSVQQMPTNRQKVIATGWGATDTSRKSKFSYNILQKVTLSVLNANTCRGIVKHEQYSIDETQFCAGVQSGGKDTCRGDSGAPLQTFSEDNVCMYDIVGITSYGFNHCAMPHAPGVYTNVASFLDWIEDKVWRQ